MVLFFVFLFIQIFPVRAIAKVVGICTVGFVSTGFTIHYTVENKLRKSSTYRKALDIFYNQKETLNHLGEPIREGAIKVKEEENSVKKFSVNVKGSKTKGILNFEYQTQPDKTNEIKKAEIKFLDVPDETFVIYNIY